MNIKIELTPQHINTNEILSDNQSKPENLEIYMHRPTSETKLFSIEYV